MSDYNLPPLPPTERNHIKQDSSKPGKNNSNHPSMRLIILTTLVVFFQFILGLFGEIIPDGIKVTLEEVAAFLGISYAQLWTICVFILLIVLIIVTIPLIFTFNRSYLKTADDVEKYLKMNVLVTIPKFERFIKNYRKLSEKDPIFNLFSRSIIAEKFRELRTAVTNPQNKITPRVLLVTSATFQEGRTTIAMNLASALSATGSKVLIIDCDLRRPILHSKYNLANSFGLSSYLCGDECKIQYCPISNVSVLTSGPIPANPSELISSREFTNLLTYVKGSFDFTVIDSPPALDFTDAEIISTIVDGVVLVASRDTKIEVIRKIIRRYMVFGAKILGVVLNKTKPDKVDLSICSTYYYISSFND